MRFLSMFLSVMTFFVVSEAVATEINSSVVSTNLPLAKTTSSKQYLTSQDAYELHMKNPGILFIDVRDPLEISMTGRPEPLDAIVPIRVQSSEFDSSIGQFALKPNPGFLDEMKTLLERSGKTK